MDTGEDLHPNDWLSVVQNPEAVKSLYISHPSLASVELHRVSFSESGWTCTVVLSSDSDPTNPPVNWKKPFNRVHIELGFVGIENVVMNGWPLKRDVEAKMTRQGDEVQFFAKGAAISFGIAASGVRICGIRAVMVGESPVNW